MKLTVSRQALERTLKQRLFDGPGGRRFLKGGAHSASFVSIEDPHLIFKQERIVVRVTAHARLGKTLGGKWLGVSVTLPAEVSVVPDADGENLGFREARLDMVSDRREIDFVLAPFLRRKVPQNMRVDAADMLRKTLALSTGAYNVRLDRLNVHSIHIVGDKLVVDADGTISIE